MLPLVEAADVDTDVDVLTVGLTLPVASGMEEPADVDALTVGLTPPVVLICIEL